MASDAVVRIVINAIDQASGVLTALNQGAELTIKAFNGIAAAGSAALKAIAGGGQFAELDRQFRFVAAAAGQSADAIVGSVDRIAQGTLDASERVKLASKAIQTGLSGPDIEAVLAFTKKFSESVGGDFQSMAAQAFEAFQSGRYGVLKQMGIFIERGDSAAVIAGKMRDALGRFGDAGFNVGDVLDRITTRLSDFGTYVARAINDSEEFQAVINAVADAVEYFTSGFDFGLVTNFFDAIIAAGRALYVSLSEQFGFIFDYIREVFTSLATKGNVKEFFLSIIDGASAAAIMFAKFGESVVNVSSLVVGGFGWLVESGGDAFQSIEYAAISAGKAILDGMSGPIFAVIRSLQNLIASSPVLASAFGADTLGAGLSAATRTLSQTSIALRELQQDALNGNNVIGETIRRTGKDIQDLAAGIDVTGMADKIGDIAGSMRAAFANNFSLEPVAAPEVKVSQAAIDAFKLTAALKAQAEDEEEEKQSERSRVRAERDRKAAIAEEKKAQDDKKRLLEQTLKDIEAVESRLNRSGAKYTLLSIEETNLLRQKDSVVKALDAINQAERAYRSESTKNLLAGVTDYKNFGKEVSAALGGNLGAAKAELTVKTEEQERQFMDYLDRLLSRVGNGQAAISDLVKSVIAAIVLQMRGERLPIAVQGLPV